MSAEPSMEDILSSIKRIIAEEGETATRTKRAAVRAPVRPAAEATHEVLELREPIADPLPEAPVRQGAAPPVAVVRAPEVPADEPIVSSRAVEASRGALDALSRLMVKPEPTNDGTLEGLVREMLRPMLREWLDANLPDVVETMVQREIERDQQHSLIVADRRLQGWRIRTRAARRSR